MNAMSAYEYTQLKNYRSSSGVTEGILYRDIELLRYSCCQKQDV